MNNLEPPDPMLNLVTLIEEMIEGVESIKNALDSQKHSNNLISLELEDLRRRIKNLEREKSNG